MEWYYDKRGCALMFIHGENFISKNGKNLCWIYNGSIYGIRSGKHIGWFEDGKVFDKYNKILAFCLYATGLPYMPGIGGTPGTPGIPGTPGQPGFSGVPSRPGYGGYSLFDTLEYFESNQ